MSTTPFGTSAMGGNAPPVEFPCVGCGRVLKVPPTVSGKQAKCPQCGTVQTVPQSSPGNAAAAPVPTPVGDATAPPPMTTASAPPAAAPMAVMPAASARASLSAPANPVPQQPTGSPPMAHSMPVGTAPPVAFGVRPAESVAISPMALTGTAPPAAGNNTPTKLLFDRIMSEIGKVYVGQDELVLGALVALFSSGHVLIESVPGLGKTLFVRTLGRVLGCKFGRIQFTADLMPSDITGAPIFDMKTQEFRFRPGPVFTQFLLADEINRSPAKTHAALLEIMQEYRVTIDGLSHTLERPFLVLATQNPIESEGTYNLPEAQLDRFMFKLVAEYPREQEEALILKLHSTQQDINQRLESELSTVTSQEEIMRVTRENADVRVDDRLLDYINKIVRLTRQWPQFHLGASPRAGIAMMQAARTLAAFSGRDYAVPDDVVQISLPALRHRVILTAEAEVEGRKVDELLTELVRSVEVPRL